MTNLIAWRSLPPPRAVGLALLLCAAAACDVSGPSESGDLGNASFFYDCEEAADAACDAGDPTTMPSIALGSTFAIDVSGDGSVRATSPTPFLQELSSGPARSVFRASIEGFAVILAEDLDQGVARGLDLDHVRIRAVDAVRFQVEEQVTFRDVDTAAPIALTVGETRRLRVAPLDVDGGELAGSLSTKWTSANPTALAITGASDNVVTIEARAEGMTKVTLAYAGFDLSFDVVVGGAQ
jgi:hypothetical protein